MILMGCQNSTVETTDRDTEVLVMRSNIGTSMELLTIWGSRVSQALQALSDGSRR